MSAESHGGTGNYQNLGAVVAWMRAINPRRVLDIGCGFGRWGFLCRDFLEIWNGRNHRREWAVHLTAVEAFERNIQAHHRELYDEIFIGPAERFLAERKDRYDLVILGDVLEHFPKAVGREVLATCMERAGYVLLVLPIGGDWPQGVAYGNPNEQHLAVWESSEVLGLQPLVACEYRDFADRPFIATVLSRSDPQAVREQLEELTRTTFGRLLTVGGTEDVPPAGRVATAVEAGEATLGQRGRGTEPLHLALVTQECAPMRGGIATYTERLARLLSGAGHRVSILTPQTGAVSSPDGLIQVIQAPQRPSAPTGSWSTDWLNEMRQWVAWAGRRLGTLHAEQPIDAIEVTDFYMEGLFLEVDHLRATGGGPVPVVTHFHGPRSVISGFDAVGHAPLLTKFEAAYVKASAFRKTYSPKMRDLANREWSGPACEFVPAPVFFDELIGGRADRITAPEYDMVYCGRLQRVKGLEQMALALRILVEEGVRPRVALVGGDTNSAPGGGSMAGWVEAELRPLLGDCLTIRDALPQAEVRDFLRRGRVVVLPSLFESLGFAMIEACCSGRPVITGRDVGAAHLFEGELADQTLVNVRSPAALADRIRSVLGASECARDELADAQMAAIRRAFPAGEVLRKTVSFYRDSAVSAAERTAMVAAATAEKRAMLSTLDDFIRIAQARRAETERMQRELSDIRGWMVTQNEAFAAAPLLLSR